MKSHSDEESPAPPPLPPPPIGPTGLQAPSAASDLRYRKNVTPFAGRLGGLQDGIASRGDPRDQQLLEREPDAAPFIPLANIFDLRPLATACIWKAAALEGTLMLVYITLWASASPLVIPVPPSAQLGPFDNAAFLGPLIGGIANLIFLSLFIFAFGFTTGAHLNPTITIATFFARLCTFPRMILYVIAQIGGASLAGLLVRASFGSSNFKAGGCWLFPDVVPVQDAFVIELVATLILLFLAFAVGLDPRQRQIVGPTLAPFLVGLTLGGISFTTAFTRYGYGGASLNPARCLGAYVGSSFPSWHWHHWVADIVACMAHGICYYLVPPWHKIDVQ